VKLQKKTWDCRILHGLRRINTLEGGSEEGSIQLSDLLLAQNLLKKGRKNATTADKEKSRKAGKRKVKQGLSLASWS